jgi:hypothetical protein
LNPAFVVAVVLEQFVHFLAAIFGVMHVLAARSDIFFCVIIKLTENP